MHESSRSWGLAFSRRQVIGISLFLILFAGACAYHNSLQGEFLLDDEPQILHNPKIRQLLPPWPALENNRRPVLYLSFALNHAWHGYRVQGYHIGNLLIHVAAACALFGILYLILRSPTVSASYRQRAVELSLACALLWLLHPVQTASVSYIVQRAESLMGLFYLLTLLGAVLFFQRGSWIFAVLAVVFCALGMGTKEVMVTAPLLVMLYDRLFVGPSFSATWKRHRVFYLGLFSTWLIMAFLLFSAHPEPVPSAGFGYVGISPLRYGLTQIGVILYYLRLAFVPYPLVFDYQDWPVATGVSDVVLPALALAVILAGCVGILKRWPRLGFAPVWFFVILLPSSSVMPIADVAFEYRLYLPLAGVIVLAVFAIDKVGQAVFDRSGVSRDILAGLLGVWCVAFAILTIHRNNDYRSERAIWQDTVRKRPNNARAHQLLALDLQEQGELKDAARHFRTSLELSPEEPLGYSNYGLLLLQQGRYSEARHYLRQALRWPSTYQGIILTNLGLVYAQEGNDTEAVVCYRQALEAGYDEAPVFSNMGLSLFRLKRFPEAQSFLHVALMLNPQDVQAAQALNSIVDRTVAP